MILGFVNYFVRITQSVIFQDDLADLGELKALPIICIGECLKFLTPKELCNFSLCNKSCLNVVKNDEILTIFIRHLRLNEIPSQFKQNTFKFGYIIYYQLRLQEKLGKEICHFIEKMEVYPKEITRAYKDLTLFDFPNKGNPKRIYKTIIEGNLTLIFLVENRFQSTLFHFNRKFNETFFEKRAFYCFKKKIGKSCEYFIDSQSYLKEKNLKKEWDHIKKDIEGFI